MNNNVIEEKSFQFAVRIVKLCKYIESTERERTLSQQLLRSGTSIGANIAEAQQAQSRADFASKISIALKEASETHYWLRLLFASGYLSEKEFNSIDADCQELLKILISITKSTKQQS